MQVKELVPGRKDHLVLRVEDGRLHHLAAVLGDLDAQAHVRALASLVLQRLRKGRDIPSLEPILLEVPTAGGHEGVDGVLGQPIDREDGEPARVARLDLHELGARHVQDDVVRVDLAPGRCTRRQRQLVALPGLEVKGFDAGIRAGARAVNDRRGRWTETLKRRAELDDLHVVVLVG